MSEEWRIEHRAHLLSVDGCPYCLKRAAMDEEPVRVGTWCMIHSAFDCAEPDCYVCSNHQMDERGRCTAPTCRATNTPEVVALVASLREVPIEYVRFVVGQYFAGRFLSRFQRASIEKGELPADRLTDAPGAVGDAGAVEPVRVTSAPAPRDGRHG